MRSFIFFVLPFGAHSSSCVDAACANDASLLAEDASLLQSIHVRGKSDPVPEEDQYGRTYKEDFTDYRHRMNAQAQQVTAKVTFNVQGDIKIKAESNPEHGTHSMNGYLDWAKYSQHRVCVAASDDAVADLQAEHAAEGEDALGFYVPEFELTEPICFNKLWIGYLAGYLNCRGPAHGKSHFGCDQDSIGLTLAKKNGDEWNVVFPKAVKDDANADANKQWNTDNIEGYEFMENLNHADWYKLSGYTGSENGMVLKINDSGDGGVFLPKGTYRLWYHEDLTGGTEGDNSGVACYHLDFSLCQGTQQSSWSINTAAPPVEES